MIGVTDGAEHIISNRKISTISMYITTLDEIYTFTTHTYSQLLFQYTCNPLIGSNQTLVQMNFNAKETHIFERHSLENYKECSVAVNATLVLFSLWFPMYKEWDKGNTRDCMYFGPFIVLISALSVC